MKTKRILSAALALALTACLAVPPARAANASFTDVSGDDAVNADILRLMGVASGTGGGRFNPAGVLTRAQFCTMVVNFLQKGDEAPLHASRTIFSDVTADHWGLAYINLAASLTVKDGERETALVSGVGDGRFRPDDEISLAEAVTILLRALGYTSKQTGTVWPQSFMALAGSIGLTDQLDARASDSITRAQAARLFVNALSCENGSGEVYYKSLGTATDGVIVLAVGVETDDGTSDGAIRTTNNKESEAYLAAAGAVKPAALVGRRGALVLNDKEEIVTFVPDESTSVTITLSDDAQPGYVKGRDGQQYTMSKDTLLYTSDDKGGSSYLDKYSTLRSGSQVTMYTQRGKIVAVYVVGSMTTSDAGAVVVSGGASAAVFASITGGASTFNIQKNRQPISLSGIKRYDVATYDDLTNTLIVSDLRLTCIYEGASPNPRTPTQITALGHTFPVLESAWDTTRNVSLGDQITLLLTADGQVAGVAKTSDGVNSTAIGVVSGGGVNVFLPNGGELKLSGTLANGNLDGHLVTVSSGERGEISASRLPSRNAGGVLNLERMELGGLTVSAGVRVFEQAGELEMSEVSLNSVGVSDIPADRIATYHLNSSGMVDYIVLNDLTGDAYEYGIMMAGYASDSSKASWSLVRGTGVITFSDRTGYKGRDGAFVAVTTSETTDGKPLIRSYKELTAIRGVSPSDFFEFEDRDYLRVDGKTYQVSEEVECCRYKSGSRYDAENWFTESTGAARLNACKGSSDNLTVYVDPVGERVRIVVAN